MLIEILCFEDCPNLAPVVKLVHEVVADRGITAEIREVHVQSPEDAVRLEFVGSPSVRVDGVDIEPAARERREFGVSCRMYGTSGVPPRAMIEDALSVPRETGPVLMTASAIASEVVRREKAESGDRGRAGAISTGAAVFAAMGASACCWLPLALLGLGVSSAGISAFFEPLRPWFLGAAAAMLTAGFYFALRPRPVWKSVGEPDCEPGSACAADGGAMPRARRKNLAMLIVGSVAVAAFAFFPSYAGALLGRETLREAGIPVRASSDEARTEVLINGMTCEACAAGVESSILQIPGVRRVEVDVEAGAATIFSKAGEAPGMDDILVAIGRSGFRAQAK